MSNTTKTTKLWWFIHNVIGHPLMAVFTLVGAEQCAEYAHENTLPPQYRRKKR